MRTLASKIHREFQIGSVGHYAAYENELQRIWPIELENRRAKIEHFAKEYGFRLGFYKQGLCAIFEPSSRASDEAQSVPRPADST
jgi:hypothetical protein